MRTPGVVAALVLFGWSPAQGQDLHGLLSTTYASINSHASDGSNADFSTFRTILDTNLNKSISETLAYRLSLRSERLDSTSTVSAGGQRTSLEVSSTLIQPQLDLTLATPGLTLHGGARARQLITDQTDQRSLDLEERYGFLRMFYSPERLPSITFQIEKNTLEDNTRPLNQHRDITRFQAGTQYHVGDLTLSYNYGRLKNEDFQQQATETQDSHIGNLGYLGRFLDGRLAVQADLSLNYVKTLQEFNRAQTAEIIRALKATFNLPSDPTPTSNTSAQFQSGASLTPLAITSAVGFTLVVADAVTEITISLVQAGAIPIPNNLASLLSFNVYHTDKEPLLTPTPPPILWTQVAVTSQSWDPVRSLFTITIPATSNKSFKAWVAADASGVPINVTGIAAPLTVSECPGCRRTQTTKSGTLSAGVSYTPIDALTLSYNVNLNASHVDPDSIDSNSGTHTLGVTVRPHEKVTTTGTLQYSFNNSNQSGALDSSVTTYSLTVSWTPLLTLVANATAARSESRTGGHLDFSNNTVNVNAAAKVFPGLQFDSGYTVSKAENFTTSQDTWGQDLTFKVQAQMAPWISATGNYTLSIRDTTPATPGQSASSVTNSVGGGTVYTISQLVNFTTRFDFVSSPAGTGFNSNYKLDWVPTSKMSFYVNYFTSNSTSGDTKTTVDAISANGRWRINRVLDLSADCLFSRTTTRGRMQDVQSFSVTGSARF